MVDSVLLLLNFFSSLLGMNRKRKGGRCGKVSGKEDQKFRPRDSGVSARSPWKDTTLVPAGQFSSWCVCKGLPSPSWCVCKGLPSRPTWASQVLGSLSRLPQVF